MRGRTCPVQFSSQRDDLNALLAWCVPWSVMTITTNDYCVCCTAESAPYLPYLPDSVLCKRPPLPESRKSPSHPPTTTTTTTTTTLAPPIHHHTKQNHQTHLNLWSFVKKPLIFIPLPSTRNSLYLPSPSDRLFFFLFAFFFNPDVAIPDRCRWTFRATLWNATRKMKCSECHIAFQHLKTSPFYFTRRCDIEYRFESLVKIVLER